MQSDFLTVLIVLGLVGLTDALTLYGVYLSLSVWRGLAVSIFKSRALWMALFGVPFAVALTYGGIVGELIPSQPSQFAPVSDVLGSLAFATLLAWIDRTVGSVIRLDYLRRDLLFWKRLRPVYWMIVVASQVLLYSGDVWISMPRSVAFAIGSIPLIYGSLCLAKGARNTRDMTFRSHVRWFGYLAAAEVSAGLVFGLYGSSAYVLISLLVLAGAYSFYKMARFLVPIGEFSVD